MNADEPKLQKQTQFVRRRRSVLVSTGKHTKKLLQRPASLEITPLPYMWRTSPVFVRQATPRHATTVNVSRFSAIWTEATMRAALSIV